MLSRRVDLLFPVELPGGTIARVTVRSISTAGYELALTGPEGRLEAIAACCGLPESVVLELSATDHARIVDAIASMAGEQQAAFLASRPAPFTVFAGGQQ
jgi:hypothetical protein